MNQKGFTLLELVVTSIIAIVTAGTMGVGWKFMNRSTILLRDRSRVVNELRAGVEFLLQDFSGAESLEKVTEPEGGIRILRFQEVSELEGAWQGGSDQGIQYFLDGTRVIRRDVNKGQDIVVAKGLDTFSITEPGGNEIHILLSGGSSQSERSITLKWKNAP